MEESQRAQQLYLELEIRDSALASRGIRHHAFNTITYSAAEFRNSNTIIYELKLSVSCLCLHFS